jgi:plasmid stability protein
MQFCMHTPRVARAAKKVDLQVRGVPAELRRKLGQKAAGRGLSMSKYVIEVLKDDVERPATLKEWFALAEELRPKRDIGFDPAETLREIRDAIDRGEKV